MRYDFRQSCVLLTPTCATVTSSCPLNNPRSSLRPLAQPEPSGHTFSAVSWTLAAAFLAAGSGVSSTVRASFWKSLPASPTAILSFTRLLAGYMERTDQRCEAAHFYQWPVGVFDLQVGVGSRYGEEIIWRCVGKHCVAWHAVRSRSSCGHALVYGSQHATPCFLELISRQSAAGTRSPSAD